MRLEDYLWDCPELGTPDAVSSELIVSEYTIRRECGDSVQACELTDRFPQQAAAVEQLLKSSLSSCSEMKSLNSRTADVGLEATRAMERLPASRSVSLRMRSQPIAPELPEQFGRYRILRPLGDGGMGTVYLARDTQLERDVALKVPHFFATDGPEVIERFYREARAAAGLRHANICPVYDVAAIDGVHFLTMAYLDGRSLSDAVAPDRPMDQQDAARIVNKLAEALHVAHGAGILHRDLKPANIMLTADGEPVIMDFGLARRMDTLDAQLTLFGTIIGTPAYMAPEVVRGDLEAMGPGCDIYAFGVILYELLTGQRPFGGPLTAVLARVLVEEPPPAEQLRPDLDPRLKAICERAMAKSLADCYPAMSDFAAELSAFLCDESFTTTRRKVRQPTSTNRPRAVSLKSIALVLAALGISLYVAVNHETTFGLFG